MTSRNERLKAVAQRFGEKKALPMSAHGESHGLMVLRKPEQTPDHAAAQRAVRGATRVEFSTNEYEFSHGKQPRGRGSWAFEIDARCFAVETLERLRGIWNADHDFKITHIDAQLYANRGKVVVWFSSGLYREARATMLWLMREAAKVTYRARVEVEACT